MISIPPRCGDCDSGTSGQERDPQSTPSGEHRRNFVAQHFWARGYYASTSGRDERVIREYIRAQEAEEQRLAQLVLFGR